MKKTLVSLGMLLLFPLVANVYSAVKPHQGSAAAIQVAEAKLGKDIKDRQLADETAEFAVNDKVYLWIKVTGAAGETLKVTWKNGDHSYTSDISVGGNSWRTWCYKTAALAGDWTVTIADAKGAVLKELNFKAK